MAQAMAAQSTLSRIFMKFHKLVSDEEGRKMSHDKSLAVESLTLVWSTFLVATSGVDETACFNDSNCKEFE